MVDNIEVDFRAENEKLIWPVSLDGKKMQSETYKILGILERVTRHRLCAHQGC
jgi:hypothetical protein